MSQPPVHLAFPVDDLGAARRFSGGVLGCPEGRSSNEWIDFEFFGHQIVAHLSPSHPRAPVGNDVDGKHVPVPHFGAVLSMAQWQAMADRLTAAGVQFVIEPYIRFKGLVGEQGTMFFYDPSGNAIEMKGFASMDQLFAK
ncbi:MAG: VOC family protein [Burkholderiaceae bacterium]